VQHPHATALEMQTALSGSPYFQRVEVLPREEQAKDLQVPIDVDYYLHQQLQKPLCRILDPVGLARFARARRRATA